MNDTPATHSAPSAPAAHDPDPTNPTGAFGPEARQALREIIAARRERPPAFPAHARPG